MRTLTTCILLFLASVTASAATKEIAITIDDLPLVASKMNTKGNIQRATERFDNIIEALKEYNVPATGFVIAGQIANGQEEFLVKFREAGFELGNHTYSHRSANGVSAEKYINDIAKADKKLTPFMTSPKYFRFPYLARGNAKNRSLIEQYLQDEGYTIAPVTIDSKDFRFNERVYHVPYRSRPQYIQRLKNEYLNYIWHATERAENKAKNPEAKQILLLHANLINSYLLSDILKMYKDKGYTFIPLSEALKAPASDVGLPEDESGEN